MFRVIEILIPLLFGYVMHPFLNDLLKRKNMRDSDRFRYLEEAYLLAIRIDSYSRETLNNMLFCIAALQNQIAFTEIPKTQNEPFSRLYVLFDFHLSAPANLKGRIEGLRKRVVDSFSPIAKAINTVEPGQKEKFYIDAIELCFEASKDAQNIADKCVEFIKSEKKNLELKTTFWKRIKIKILGVRSEKMVDF